MIFRQRQLMLYAAISATLLIISLPMLTLTRLFIFFFSRHAVAYFSAAFSITRLFSDFAIFRCLSLAISMPTRHAFTRQRRHFFFHAV